MTHTLYNSLSLLQTGPSNPGTWLQVINAISLLLAMWGVISLLRALEHKLSRNRIRAKFIAVQLAMIFSVAQNAILSLLASRNVIGCVSTRGSMVQANRKIYVQVQIYQTNNPPPPWNKHNNQPQNNHNKQTHKHPPLQNLNLNLIIGYKANLGLLLLGIEPLTP